MEPEAHEEYFNSDPEDIDGDNFELYDPNESKSVDVNSKNKATSLKKIILESIGLYKKANIILLKHQDSPEAEWIPFESSDYDSSIKSWANKTIAYKVFMEVTVYIEGRGHSYRTSMKVDPKEVFESSLKAKTHFWKTFMCRGG
jgi:hypothetical protein